MNLPAKLKQLNTFQNGVSFLGETVEVALPVLGRTFEEYRGGGMGRPIKVDMGGTGLEMEVTWGGFMREVARQYGAVGVDDVQLVFRGAYQSDGNGRVQAIEIVTRGRYEEINAGTAKAGGDTEFKAKATLAYYKLTIDGIVEAEIDVLNMIERIGGVDRMAEIRRAVGG